MKKLLLLKICFILFVTIFSTTYANEFMGNLEEVRKIKIMLLLHYRSLLMNIYLNIHPGTHPTSHHFHIWHLGAIY